MKFKRIGRGDGIRYISNGDSIYANGDGVIYQNNKHDGNPLQYGRYVYELIFYH